MCLDHDAACCADSIVELVTSHLHHALVIFYPLLIDTVEKVFILPEVDLYAEHDCEVFALCSLQSALVT